MRRAAPPQQLRVDPTDPGPWARVAAGPRGLGLVGAPAPDGDLADQHVVLRPARGVPFATSDAVIVNEGALALTVAPGVARTLRLPDMANLFDRRPPGLRDVAGAVSANAGLLCDDSGWRAVVLPSMGDLVADLGPGPVAIRADGRRVGVAHGGRVFEVELPGAATNEHGDVDAFGLAYGHDGALVVVGAEGIGDHRVGSPIATFTVASHAPRALSLHHDGQVRVWDVTSDAVVATWSAPQGVRGIALNADGTLVALRLRDGDQAAAALCRADDGAFVRHIAGANVIAFDPADRGLMVGGDWGALWIEPPREG